jgi:hypothetical protein
MNRLIILGLWIISGAIGAVLVVSFAAPTPQARSLAGQAQVNDKIITSPPSVVLGKSATSDASDELAPVSVVSVWRVGERAGAMIMANDSKPRPVSIGDSIGSWTLVAVAGKEATFQNASGMRKIISEQVGEDSKSPNQSNGQRP